MPSAGEPPGVSHDERESCGARGMLDRIDAAVDVVESTPGDAAPRRRSYGDGLWGIPVRDRNDDWLIIWEHDAEDDDLIIVRYLGVDPFSSRQV